GEALQKHRRLAFGRPLDPDPLARRGRFPDARLGRRNGSRLQEVARAPLGEAPSRLSGVRVVAHAEDTEFNLPTHAAGRRQDEPPPELHVLKPFHSVPRRMNQRQTQRDIHLPAPTLKNASISIPASGTAPSALPRAIACIAYG